MVFTTLQQQLNIFRNSTSRRVLTGLFALLMLLNFVVPAFGAGFSDVPKDHWAYKAIEQLVEQGYLDGFADDTFRGRKVISRYELAITLAKMLDKVQDIESSGGVLSKADAERIKKLAKEFRNELTDIGVKMTTIENRIAELEKFRKDQEKITIGGFYQTQQWFTWDRLSTKNDPHNWPLDEVDARDTNGLTDLNQELHLKVTGKPSDQIEAYMEMVGYLNQDMDAYWRYWNYEEVWMKETSVTRPWLDNRVVNRQRDKDVYMDKAHLTFTTDYATIKAFAEERFQKFDDPANLLNGSGKNMNNSNTPRVFQGVETTGSVKDLSYQLSFLRERESPSSTDYFINDDTDMEDYELSYYVKDIFGARMVYRVPEKLLDRKDTEIAIGASFAERAKNYTKIGDFEQVNGADLFFKFTDVGTIKTSAEYLESRSGVDADNVIIRDNGFKIDSEFSLEPLTLIVNHYKYGKDFFAGTTRWDSLFIDIGDEPGDWNYGREGVDGEKLTRLTLKYDQRFGDDTGIRTEGIAQQKKWEVDPTHKVFDMTAHLYSFQIWADMSRYINGRIYSELKKDAFLEEIGSTLTEVEFNGKFPEVNNLSGQFRFSTTADRDSSNKAGTLERGNTWYGEIAADVAPQVWSKVTGQRAINFIGWHDGNTENPDTTNTEVVTDTVGFETNVSMPSDFTVTFDYHTAHDTYPNFPKENLRRKWFITGINKIFTDKLKFKARYWWKDYTKWSNNYNADSFYWSNDNTVDYPSNENNLRNWTIELTYEPITSSKFRVLWGDWIDYKQDEKDIETERKLYFEMKTEF